MWMVDNCKNIDTFKWSPKGSPLKKGTGSPFKDRISAYPYAKDGYNAYFDYIQNSKKITKLFNTHVKSLNAHKKNITLNNNKKIKYDYLINTISPDEIYNYQFGKLNFVGRDLHLIVLPKKSIFPKNVFFLYYPNNEKFTRLVEYKKFTLHKSNSSLIGMEIPSLNGRYYPMPISKEQKKAKKYFKLMRNNIYSIGRAGTYRYEVDIDDSIAQSIEIFNQIKNKKYYGPIIGDDFK